MFNFSFDSTAGVLQVRVAGSWTAAEVERYAREARVQFTDARKKAGNLRLLIDLGAAHVLSQELMDPLAKAGMQYSQPDDRVAMVVGSTLLKLQMRRMLGEAPVPIFLSATEAMNWMLSDKDVSAAG
ncbi:MAG: hypothetical protein J7485_03950 [Sphingobium sp.]|nr:hypothetical protein [Sphingobium sp.]